MDEILAVIVQQAKQQSPLEIIAVLLSIAYVWLAAEQNRLCWPAALISTLLFTYVFWDARLTFQMLLNAYYAIMAVVGWFSWQKTGQIAVTGVSTMPWYLHLACLLLGSIITAIIVIVAQDNLQHDYLFLDTAIAVFSLITTWLTVRKYLQSWIYWSIINAMSIHLFIVSELYFTAVLMFVYLLLAIRGYVQWQQSQFIASQNVST